MKVWVVTTLSWAWGRGKQLVTGSPGVGIAVAGGVVTVAALVAAHVVTGAPIYLALAVAVCLCTGAYQWRGAWASGVWTWARDTLAPYAFNWKTWAALGLISCVVTGHVSYNSGKFVESFKTDRAENKVRAAGRAQLMAEADLGAVERENQALKADNARLNELLASEASDPAPAKPAKAPSTPQKETGRQRAS